jgi:hypothetical protein
MHIQSVDPATILSTLRRGHPRLLLTPQRLAQFRQQSRDNRARVIRLGLPMDRKPADSVPRQWP